MAELPGRSGYNAYHLLEYDFGALLACPLYRAIEPSEGRLRYWWHDYTALLLSALLIGGFVLKVRRRLGLAELTIPIFAGDYGAVALPPISVCAAAAAVGYFLFPGGAACHQ